MFRSTARQIAFHFSVKKLLNALSIMMVIIESALLHKDIIFIVQMRLRFLGTEITTCIEMLFSKLLYDFR